MIIGYEREYVEITEQERVPDTLPTPGDVRVEVTVRLDEFGGRYARVWLAKPDLERFIGDLEAVLSSYAGQACLEAMSPDEFSLQVEPSDLRGHFIVYVRLVRPKYIGEKHCTRSVEGEFEVEFGQLVSILSGFKGFVN